MTGAGLEDGAPRALVVRTGPALRGSFRPPGDKSITHRAYLFALLGAGETRVVDPNLGEDCERTSAACAALGVRIERSADPCVLLSNRGLSAPQQPLDCGNSGTTLRLLAGILASQSFEVTLIGDRSLSRRPLDRVIEPLRAMGAVLTAAEGDRFAPLHVRGATLRGCAHRLAVSSAQVASALCFAGWRASGETLIEIPGPARDHTERMAAACGLPIEVQAEASGARRLRVRSGSPVTAREFRVPADPSAAAFLLAAAAAAPGAEVTATGLTLNPTRTGFLEVLEAVGAEVIVTSRGEASGDPVGDVTVRGPEQLRAFDIPSEWVPRLVDEVPAWAILASAARGTSRLRGAAELRVKESDRLRTLAEGLTRLGIEVHEAPDGLEIVGGELRGGAIEARNDHRIAMAFAVMGTRAAQPVRIDDARSIATSFPEFESVLARLGGRLEHPAEGR
ncbi:MAG: 3-phosphoshikimate 1-carboxyvinyltransferase [Candidatus Eisenbacteria bacterium]|uniref:3-phosphoshikimate 1-carboxyvinyltransferase n=1 Tax=Eiseniibacteriota bacterium TaxID=2212470 RepID=A0A849SKP4_UNCEI|nr:3-phosphoshikimate 1-carboxyvinyltransferase [Candidatus Eisenbacteria bacterium]